MSINIHILTASPKLNPYRRILNTITKKTVKLVGLLIPLRNIDIVLYDNPEDTIKEIGGIGGYAPNAHVVLISLNPLHPRFKWAIEHELPSTLAHELHHAVRWRKPGYGWTFWEHMVTEGLADHFAMEITGIKKPPPWSKALTVKQKKILLNRAKQMFHRLPFSLSDHWSWFYGSKEQNIPRWTGYTLGYDIVATYLKTHPNAKASKLVATPADLFVPKNQN